MRPNLAKYHQGSGSTLRHIIGSESYISLKVSVFSFKYASEMFLKKANHFILPYYVERIMQDRQLS